MYHKTKPNQTKPRNIGYHIIIWKNKILKKQLHEKCKKWMYNELKFPNF